MCSENLMIDTGNAVALSVKRALEANGPITDTCIGSVCFCSTAITDHDPRVKPRCVCIPSRGIAHVPYNIGIKNNRFACEIMSVIVYKSSKKGKIGSTANVILTVRLGRNCPCRSYFATVPMVSTKPYGLIRIDGREIHRDLCHLGCQIRRHREATVNG